jgi:hypothetical protein
MHFQDKSFDMCMAGLANIYFVINIGHRFFCEMADNRVMLCLTKIPEKTGARTDAARALAFRTGLVLC